MIVVDSSAVIAMMQNERSAPALASRLEETARDRRLLSTANYVEAGAVIAGRRRSDRHLAIAELDGLLSRVGVTVVSVDARQAAIALDARIRYGKGMGHGGKLNFGDCFAYALAKSLNAPLLFVGDDFQATDIVSAL